MSITSREYCQASSITWCFFRESEVTFYLTSTSTWHDCLYRVHFKPCRVQQALWTVRFRLPRFVTVATWGLHLWMADGWYCRENFAGIIPGRRRSPWSHARRPMGMAMINFTHFIVDTWKTGRAIFVTTFVILAHTRRRRCCGQISDLVCVDMHQSLRLERRGYVSR